MAGASSITERGQPCLIHLWTVAGWLSPPPTLNYTAAFDYNCLIHEINYFPKPNALKVLNKSLWTTELIKKFQAIYPSNRSIYIYEYERHFSNDFLCYLNSFLFYLTC